LRGVRGVLCVGNSNTNTPLTPLKGGIRTRQSVNYFSANMKDAPI